MIFTAKEHALTKCNLQFGSELVRDASVYCAYVHPTPLVVTTGPATLQRTGETTATLAFEDPASAAFFQAFETDQLVSSVIQHRDAWFGSRAAELDDEFLRSGLRTFSEGETLKIRLLDSSQDDTDLVVYDAANRLVTTPLAEDHPVRVKAVLEFSKITFGKTSYGGLWKVKQLKLLDPPPACLFAADDQEEEDPPQKVLFPELEEAGDNLEN